jgi:hypothetical protein
VAGLIRLIDYALLMRERSEHRVFQTFQQPRHALDIDFPQIEITIVIEEFLTSLFRHINTGISKKDGLHLSQEDPSLFSKTHKARHVSAAEMMFSLLIIDFTKAPINLAMSGTFANLHGLPIRIALIRSLIPSSCQ